MEPITILREKDFLAIINVWWSDYYSMCQEIGEWGDEYIHFYRSRLSPLLKSYEFDLKYDMDSDKWIITHKHEED